MRIRIERILPTTAHQNNVPFGIGRPVITVIVVSLFMVAALGSVVPVHAVVYPVAACAWSTDRSSFAMVEINLAPGGNGFLIYHESSVTYYQNSDGYSWTDKIDDSHVYTWSQPPLPGFAPGRLVLTQQMAYGIYQYATSSTTDGQPAGTVSVAITDGVPEPRCPFNLPVGSG